MAEKKVSKIEKFSENMTNWIGSSHSILLHTFMFIAIFALAPYGFHIDDVLLILTTIVSLEAIYLALFIQMTVNRNTRSLVEVEEDIGEIAEDVEGLEKEFDDIQEDVEDISEDIDKIGDGTERKPVSTTNVNNLQNQLDLLNSLTKSIESLKEEIKTLKKE